MRLVSFRFVMPAGPVAAGPKLVLFWHENLLFPAYTHAPLGVPVLVSQHRDGELITQVLRMLRGRAVRGSTTRGGAAALRRMARLGRLGSLAITPDGPRGPRRKLQMGAIFLASRTGMPIVLTGMAYSRCWRVGSWDRMAIPKPGAVGICITDEPVAIPPELDREGLERWRQRVEGMMVDLQHQAERLAAAGSAPQGSLSLAAARDVARQLLGAG
jgi:lysophospholipid acyltransferase (LPLAT)-like uncharacterized protein